MNDDDMLGRVRAAVHTEVGLADDGLADRLLRGTVRAKRSRRTGTLALAALVLAGAGLGGATLQAGSEEGTLRIEGAKDPSLAGHQTPVQANAVSAEQASRRGLDGTAECDAFAASNAGPVGGDVTTRLRLQAAYLTDTDGLEAWSREFSGSFTIWKVPPPLERIATCWFVGDVAPDLSVGPPTVAFTYQMVAIPVDAPAGGGALRLDTRSANPIPVLAPPVPAGTPASAPLVVFPQPDGIPVLDELPPGPILLPPDPDDFLELPDCDDTGCADPSIEVIVTSEARLDGVLLDPLGVSELVPGQVVRLQVKLDVEDDQAVTDVALALTTDNGSVRQGPAGLTGVDQIFTRAASVSGLRTFELTWTVPEIPSVKQLVLGYRSEKGDNVVEPLRYLGQFVNPRD